MFFCHENHLYPPSISQGGILRFGTKSDLLECLISLSPGKSASTDTQLTVDAYIFDGALIVQMLKPGLCVTFDDHKHKVFYIMSVLSTTSRVDVVFDVYHTQESEVSNTRKAW